MAIKPPKRILVTGGAGFIGSNVVKAAKERYPATKIRVLHLPNENLQNLQTLKDVEDVEFVAGDITVEADVRNAVKDCDVVIHMAAVYAFWLPDMSLMHRVNVEGTRRVFEECVRQHVERVVYTSSAVCFCGQGLDVVSDEQSPFSMPDMVYAKSKYDSHQIAEEFARDGLDVVIVCPAIPVGPGDIGPTPSGRLIIDIFNLPVPLAVPTEMNFIDVRDCAMGHLLALERGKTGESYILGGENFRYKDMLRRALRVAGKRRRIWEAPRSLLKPVGALMVAVANRTGTPPLMTPTEAGMANRGVILNAAKARRELGLTVRPLEQSLRDAIAWFVEHDYIKDRSVGDNL